jgi:hypothetical protein
MLLAVVVISTTKTTDVTSGMVSTSIARSADDELTVCGRRATYSVNVVMFTSPEAQR